MAGVVIAPADDSCHIHFEHITHLGEDHAPLPLDHPSVRVAGVNAYGQLAKFAGAHHQGPGFLGLFLLKIVTAAAGPPTT